MNRIWIGGGILVAASVLLSMCSGNRGARTRSAVTVGSNVGGGDAGVAPKSAPTAVASPPSNEATEASEVPLVITGLVECDNYIERYLRCESIPLREREIQRTIFEEWKKHVESGRDAQGLADSCAATSEVQGPSMTQLGC